jgi:predicted RNA-binding protein with PIN domain
VEDVDRRLIVDAMNVIGSRPTGWWRDRDGAVREFAGRLRRYAETARAEVTLVIDGFPVDGLPEGEQGGVQVLYAHSRERDAADDRIVALVEASDEPVTVVTADRDLRKRAGARGGAQLMGPRQLLRRLDRDGRP